MGAERVAVSMVENAISGWEEGGATEEVTLTMSPSCSATESKSRTSCV